MSSPHSAAFVYYTGRGHDRRKAVWGRCRTTAYHQRLPLLDNHILEFHRVFDRVCMQGIGKARTRYDTDDNLGILKLAPSYSPLKSTPYEQSIRVKGWRFRHTRNSSSVAQHPTQLLSSMIHQAGNLTLTCRFHLRTYLYVAAWTYQQPVQASQVR